MRFYQARDQQPTPQQINFPSRVLEDMGEGEVVKTRDEGDIGVEESGEIFFFYRPKVNRDEAVGEQDVQRLYMVLRPESGATAVEQKQAPADQNWEDEKGNNEDPSSSAGGHGVQKVGIEKEELLRLMIMGKKSLPDPSEKKKGRPYWGFVELVTINIEDIKNALREEEYETSTRGRRQKPAARAVGEGVYRILKHGSKNSSRTHTHLIYKLEFPSPEKISHEEQSPQKPLNIDSEASFIIQIKNPNQQQRSHQSSSGLQSKRKAAFPAQLQAKLGGSRRFCPAEPPDLLNYEGCEFLLISASDNLEEELGIELIKDQSSDDPYHCSDLVHTFGETVSTTPLFQGTWA